MAGKNAAEQLAALLSEGKGTGVQLQAGTCVYRDGAWRVSRGGMELTSVVWLESASPRTGPCLLAIDTPPGGQSIAYVLGFTFEQPYRKQDIATVNSTPVGGILSIDLDDGTTYKEARSMSHYTPAVNDRCFVIWKGGEAYVVGKFPNGHNIVRAPAPPPLPELPRNTPTGLAQFPPCMVSVWSLVEGGWMKGRSRDMRITPTQYAVWAYGGATRSLVDKNILDSATLTFGKRSRNEAGADKDVKVELYCSDNDVLTDAAPTLQEGPYSLTIPAYYKGEPLDIPTELAQSLQSGGSIIMKTAVTPVTFLDSPAHGYLKVNWRTA